MRHETGLRTIFGEGARRRASTGHGHRFATASASLGESRAEGLPALSEVLSGAIDFCSELLASDHARTCELT